MTVKLTVGRRSPDGAVYFGLELQVASEDLERTKDWAVEKVNQWMAQEGVAQEVQGMPEVDEGALLTLEWYAYSKARDGSRVVIRDGPGWTFSNKAPAEVIGALQRLKPREWLPLGAFEYRLGGQDGTLIQRRIIKVESAKR